MISIVFLIKMGYLDSSNLYVVLVCKRRVEEGMREYGNVSKTKFGFGAINFILYLCRALVNPSSWR